MVEKYKNSKDKNEYKKCNGMLEDAYIDLIKFCRAKSLDPKIGIIAKNASDKSGYFCKRYLYETS
jgi:hypothetical protein